MGFGIGILITGGNLWGHTQHTDFNKGFTKGIFIFLIGFNLGCLQGNVQVTLRK